MSKINELRKKAVEAARKRDWSAAVKLYEKVCDIDSNNPGFRNELGDIFVKMGQVPQALLAFEKAAEAYRTVGLHNNAVAVYKKILRHEANNLDALWGLGDLKEQQGLQTDAASHYIDFLARADDIPSSSRQKFVNRCLLLIERYDDDLQMLSRIESIFERWKLGEDHARVLIQKARLARSEGQVELIEKYVARAREVFDDLDVLDDYLQLRKEMSGGADAADVEDSVDADGSDVVEVSENIPDVIEAEPVAAAESAREIELTDDTPPEEIDLGFDFEADEEGDQKQDELTEEEFRPNSTIEIDALSIRSLTQELSIQMARPVAAAKAAPVARQPEPVATPEPPAPARQSAPSSGPPSSGSLNLLDQLLSSSEYDKRATDAGQVDTIEADVAAQIAGHVAADDYQGQYDVGIIYLDMGLNKSAIEAFDRAARGPELRLKALEMRGNVLRQIGRLADALAAYQEGLHTFGQPVRAYLGLHFETGACLTELGQLDDALYHFEQAAAIDANFLDVQERVRRLAAQTTR